MMDGKQAEKVLSILYSSAVILSTVSVASLLIAWQHWAWTLDSCIDVYCECILYGVNTFSTFMGGDVKLCHFGTYGLAPIILVGLILASYHGYRTCIDRSLDRPRRVSRTTAYCSRNSIDGTVVIVTSKARTPCKQWMPAAFLAALLSCLSLTHAVILTDGYYRTCDQYRRNLIQILGSRGREVQVIHNRLSCGAIFDFMDYLHPDTNNWIRGDEINTGVSLQLAIVTSWLNFTTLTIICIINLIMARKRHKSLGEKWCCCF
ncbi:uncharacterized protein [Venturia canescens]|uniref:uncharacterized protein n=1 Tax=Venturia canescens TaxID=32260 RepID=UPI001C9D1D0B|nr:uncharacterized protein LOC122409607 [Venturia canescens]